MRANARGDFVGAVREPPGCFFRLFWIPQSLRLVGIDAVNDDPVGTGRDLSLQNRRAVDEGQSRGLFLHPEYESSPPCNGPRRARAGLPAGGGLGYHRAAVRHSGEAHGWTSTKSARPRSSSPA